MIPILQSGGATGADTIFDQCARAAGHRIENYSFEGHRTDCNNLVILSQNQLKQADSYLTLANKTLKRPLNLNETSNRLCLLRRNYYQIKDSTAVYAVSWLNVKKQLVEGGTGWAVMMGINKKIPIYLFDQYTNEWVQWVQIKWMGITQPPKPEGIYTGIGSRKLTEKGIAAIQKLYTF